MSRTQILSSAGQILARTLFYAALLAAPFIVGGLVEGYALGGVVA